LFEQKKTHFSTPHQIYFVLPSKKTKKKTGATPTPSGSAAPFSAAPVAPDAPVAIYGDYLDRKLQKRISNLLTELSKLHISVTEFYADLHKTSGEFNSDQSIHAQGAQRAGFVEINNRQIPVLQRLRTAGLIGNKNDGTGNNNIGKSPLLSQMRNIVAKLEAVLSMSEEDILRVVVLHHKLRKNF
jgi:hypothetical protein